jgi:hypothetical protein
MEIEKMKGYKTVIANLMIIIGAGAAMLGVDVAQETLNELGAGLIAAIGAGNIVLRAFTDSSIFNR